MKFSAVLVQQEMDIMKDDLVFKKEFDWEHKDVKLNKVHRLNTLEYFSLGVLIGSGSILAIQLALALIDKL